MKTYQKLLLALAVVILTAFAIQPAAATNYCSPGTAYQLAEATSCFHDAIQPLRDSGTYNESRSLTSNGNGTSTVTYTYSPKCLNSNPPCGLATRIVTATINCSTGAVTCP